MVEFEKKEEAQLAIDEMDGSQLLEQDISVNWAFVRGTSCGTVGLNPLNYTRVFWLENYLELV